MVRPQQTLLCGNWRLIILLGNGYKCLSFTGGCVREISHICVKALVPTLCFAWGTIVPQGTSQVI